MKNSISALHFGLQRSGTNYFVKYFKDWFGNKIWNLENVQNISRNSPLHKHFRLYDNKDLVPELSYYNNCSIMCLDDYNNLVMNFGKPNDLFDLKNYPIFIITKDPINWLSSYKKWAIKCNWELKETYINEYFEFYGRWLLLANEGHKIMFIKYIDLVNKPIMVAFRILFKIGFLFKLQVLLKSLFGRYSIEKVAISPNFSTESLKSYKPIYRMNDFNLNAGLSEYEKEVIISNKEILERLKYV